MFVSLVGCIIFIRGTLRLRVTLDQIGYRIVYRIPVAIACYITLSSEKQRPIAENIPRDGWFAPASDFFASGGAWECSATDARHRRTPDTTTLHILGGPRLVRVDVTQSHERKVANTKLRTLQ